MTLFIKLFSYQYFPSTFLSFFPCFFLSWHKKKWIIIAQIVKLFLVFFLNAHKFHKNVSKGVGPALWKQNKAYIIYILEYDLTKFWFLFADYLLLQNLGQKVFVLWHLRKLYLCLLLLVSNARQRYLLQARRYMEGVHGWLL